MPLVIFLSLFFFNDTATTDIYTLSLHDALPISTRYRRKRRPWWSEPTPARSSRRRRRSAYHSSTRRSEEHTSELQSRGHLVCRLLLEKKNKTEKKVGNYRHMFPEENSTQGCRYL